MDSLLVVVLGLVVVPASGVVRRSRRAPVALAPVVPVCVAVKPRAVCVALVACVVLVVRRGMSGSGGGVRRCVSLCVVGRFRTRRKRSVAKRKRSSVWMRCG